MTSYHQAYGFKNPSLPRVRNTRQKSALQRLITHNSFQLLHCKSCQFNVFPTQLSADVSPTIPWDSYLQLSSASEHFPTTQNGSELKWPNKNRWTKIDGREPVARRSRPQTPEKQIRPCRSATDHKRSKGEFGAGSGPWKPPQPKYSSPACGAWKGGRE